MKRTEASWRSIAQRLIVLTFLFCLTALAHSAAASTFLFEPVPAEGSSWFKAVFLPSENPSLRIRLFPDAQEPTAVELRPEDVQLQGRLLDFWSQPAGDVVIQAAKSAVRAKTSKTALEFILEPRTSQLGWFRIELTLKIGDQTAVLKRKPAIEKTAEDYDFLAFARVLPPRDRAGNSPFGVVSGLLPQPLCPIEAQLEFIRLSGASWAREMFGWRQINPAPGKFVWAQKKKEVSALSNLGINVVAMLQEAPTWTHPHAGDKAAFPEDLTAAFDVARDAAKTFGSEVKAWETWNEPDISHYAIEPPDRYASMLKALSLGFAAGATAATNTPPLVLLGAFARDPQAGGYASLLAANDVASYLDAYNFHTYHPVVGGRFSRVVQTHLKVAAETGFGNKALWLTETSLPFARNRIPQPLPAMSAQLRQLCESYMIALQHDIRPIFWFIVRPFISKHTAKPSQWGMFDSQLSPVPAFPAYSVMCRELGTAHLLGTIPLPSNTGTAYVFDNGNEEVAVVLGAANADDVPLPPVADNATACDVMGNEVVLQKSDANGETRTVVSTRGYSVYIRRAGWSQLAAFSPHKQRPTVAPASRPTRSAVVLQAAYPMDAIDEGGSVYENWDDLAANWAPRGYVFEPGKRISATLNIYNFSEKLSHGKVRLLLPEGFTADPASIETAIPPRGKVSIAFSVQTPASIANNSVRWTWQGEFDDHSITPSVSRWRRK